MSGVIKDFDDSKNPDFSIYKDAFTFTIVNIVGSLFPILASTLLVAFFGHWTGISRFIKNGEIFIICISILISACYTFYKNRFHKKGFNIYSTTFLVSALILILSIVVFSGGAAQDVLKIGENHVDYLMIKYSSVFLVVFSTISLFIAQINEYKKNDLDLAREEREADYNELKAKFKTSTNE